MGVEKEVLVGLKENYEKVKKLLYEDSKYDPEDKPYASKYAAKSILLQMKGSLLNIIESVSGDDELFRYQAMLGAVLLYTGIISVDTEELTGGVEQLTKCVELFENNEKHPKAIITVLTALNQLGIVWSNRDNAKKSKVFLDRSEILYKEFKDSGIIPLDIVDLFMGPDDKQSEESAVSLEKVHTLTLYYLAQIYGSLEDYLKSAIYCHITLKRQLEYKDFEPIDWALNSATLSQFFMEKNGFKQSRHHLAAASFILDNYGDELAAEQIMDEAHDAKMEIFKHRSADVARCWVKYGLLLLSNSKDRLMHHADDSDDALPCSLSSDLALLQLSDDSSVSSADLSHLYFQSLSLSVYEDQVTDKFILTYDDAKVVFLNVQQWIDKAKQYYTMDNLASDHVQIIQDASQLYKYLAFFEDNDERQAKMHKRRIDLLEPIIKELNPLYYTQLCRQIWYELAETYSNILDIKLEKHQTSDERPTPQSLKKINHLSEQSIKNFESFLNSLKEPMSGEMPKKLPADMAKPALMAYFHVGRLYMKMIVLDKQGQLENTEKSLNAYSTLVNYCDTDKSAAALMTAELSVCREMASLLPLKVLRLKENIVT